MSKRQRAAIESSETPSTPTHEGQKSLGHFPIPTKAKVLDAVEYLEKRNISHSKADIFDVFEVKKRDEGRILAENKQSCHHHNDSFSQEHQDRHLKLTNEDISKIDKILQDYGINGRILTGEQLAFEANIEDVSGYTIRCHIYTIYYRKYLACKKEGISKKATDHQVNWTST